VAEDGTELSINGGSIHGLLRQQSETIAPALETLNTLAFALIHEVNRLHSQGQGERGWTQVTGTVEVQDVAVAMNATGSGIQFPIENGSFSIHLRDPDSGDIVDSFEINVNGNTMSLQDLVLAIQSASGGAVTASIDGAGRLELTAPSGMELTFSDDTSGVLSALGVNTFFTGSSATDIAVSAALIETPDLLALGSENIPGSTETALGIAALQDVGSAVLEGQSLSEFWRGSVGTLAVRTNAGAGMFQSSSLVRESLGVQMMSVSGVSMDEETINLLAYERQFEAAARYLSVVDETLEILMNLV
jgi:flagellar hook-associated protein 1 FlgK